MQDCLASQLFLDMPVRSKCFAHHASSRWTSTCEYEKPQRCCKQSWVDHGNYICKVYIRHLRRPYLIMQQRLRPNCIRHPIHATKTPKPLASRLGLNRTLFTLRQDVMICNVAVQRNAATLTCLDVSFYHQCIQKAVLQKSLSRQGCLTHEAMTHSC